MNASRGSAEQRRAQRKRVTATSVVVDVITGEPFGELGNLSATGMLLISPRAPRSEAIYQLRLPLPAAGKERQQIEVGVQEQWHEPAATPGRVWAGFRIVAIDEESARRLGQWLQATG